MKRRILAAPHACETVEVAVSGTEVDPQTAEPTAFAVHAWFQAPDTWYLRDGAPSAPMVRIHEDPLHLYLDEHGNPANGRAEGAELLSRIPWVAMGAALDSVHPTSDAPPTPSELAGRPASTVRVTSEDGDRPSITVDDQKGLVLGWSADEAPWGATVETIDFNAAMPEMHSA